MLELFEIIKLNNLNLKPLANLKLQSSSGENYKERSDNLILASLNSK